MYIYIYHCGSVFHYMVCLMVAGVTKKVCYASGELQTLMPQSLAQGPSGPGRDQTSNRGEVGKVGYKNGIFFRFLFFPDMLLMRVCGFIFLVYWEP